MLRARTVCMKLVAIVGLALALLAPACAPPDPDAFDVAPALRVPIEVAARTWCDLGAPCVYQAPEGPSSVGVARRYDSPREVGHIDFGPDGVSSITVLAGLDPGLELAVMTHELGHHFGCDHSDDPNDVMFGWADALVTVPTARDLACAK